MATIGLTEAQCAEFENIVSEMRQYPQNQFNSTMIERLAKLAVATGAPNACVFMEGAKDQPIVTLLTWLLYTMEYGEYVSPAAIAKLQCIIDKYKGVPQAPGSIIFIDANVVDMLVQMIREMIGSRVELGIDCALKDLFRDNPLAALLEILEDFWCWDFALIDQGGDGDDDDGEGQDEGVPAPPET